MARRMSPAVQFGSSAVPQLDSETWHHPYFQSRPPGPQGHWSWNHRKPTRWMSRRRLHQHRRGTSKHLNRITWPDVLRLTSSLTNYDSLYSSYDLVFWFPVG